MEPVRSGDRSPVHTTGGLARKLTFRAERHLYKIKMSLFRVRANVVAADSLVCSCSAPERDAPRRGRACAGAHTCAARRGRVQLRADLREHARMCFRERQKPRIQGAFRSPAQFRALRLCAALRSSALRLEAGAHEIYESESFPARFKKVLAFYIYMNPRNKFVSLIFFSTCFSLPLVISLLLLFQEK